MKVFYLWQSDEAQPMTNDEYQKMERERRRKQEEDELRRSMDEYQRQQRQQRERDNAELLARISYRVGQVGGGPSLGAPIDAQEHQKGLWEYQMEQDRQRNQEEYERRQRQRRERDNKEQQAKVDWPVNTTSSPQLAPTRRAVDRSVNTISSPRRSWRLVGRITAWFIHHAWPFSALHDWGEDICDSGRAARFIMAIVGGLAALKMLSLPALHHQVAQELLSSPGPIYAAAFIIGALVGSLSPTIFGLVLVVGVRLTGVLVEIGIYAGVIWIIVKAVNSIH